MKYTSAEISKTPPALARLSHRFDTEQFFGTSLAQRRLHGKLHLGLLLRWAK